MSRRARTRGARWRRCGRAAGGARWRGSWRSVTTLGSLYYSEHAGFVPCELCWYQRIVMYPLVDRARRRLAATRPQGLDDRVAVRGGRRAVVALPLAGRAGAELRGEHSCSVAAPCTAPYFEKLGFVTLAWMCLSSFLADRQCCMVFARSWRTRASGADDGSAGTVADVRQPSGHNAARKRWRSASRRRRSPARPCSVVTGSSLWWRRRRGRGDRGRGRRVVVSSGGDDAGATATKLETANGHGRRTPPAAVRLGGHATTAGPAVGDTMPTLHGRRSSTARRSRSGPTASRRW